MLPTALLATLALASRFDTEDPAFAALVPTDAAALVRIESLDALDRAVTMLATEVETPIPFEGRKFLAAVFECPGPTAAIDGARPIAIALSLPPGAMKPLRTFILPVADTAAYAAAVATKPAWRTASAAGYLAISELDAYAPTAMPSPLCATVARTLVAATIDGRRVQAAYGPLLEIGAERMRRSLDDRRGLDPLASEIATSVPDFYEDLLDALVRTDLAVALDGSRVRATIELTLDPDTALGAANVDGPRFDAQLAQRLPLNATVQTVSRIELRILDRAYTELLAQIEREVSERSEEQPPAARERSEHMLDALQRVSDVLPLLGGRNALAYTLGADRVQLAGCVESSDPARVLAEFGGALADLASMVSREVPHLSYADAVERSLGGVAFSETTLHLDRAVLDGAPPESSSKQQALYQMFFGDQGLRLTRGVTGPLLLVGVNLDDPDLERLASCPAVPLDPTLAALADASSGVWMRMDVGGLIAFGAQLDADTLQGVDRTVLDALHARVTVWGGARASTWFGGAGADLAEIGALVRAIRGAR